MQKGNCGLLLYVHGDDTEDKVLRKAGITRAAGLVAIVANDADNVFITLTAGGLNSTINIVARAEKPETEEKLRRAGANKVINPSSMAGIQIGKRVLLIGKTLIESSVRSQFDITILAILKDGNIIYNPTGQAKL